MEHEAYLREAIAIARASARAGGGPFGTVIVKDGAIIGRGGNRVTLENDPTAHSEIVAIRDACATLQDFQLAGCQVYASTEPCPMCLGALYWARPDAVYYASTREDAAAAGFDDAFIYEEIAKAPPERTVPFHPLLQDEARAVLEDWSRDPARTRY